MARRRKRKSIEGFADRDRHGAFEGVPDINQGHAIVHGPQIADSKGAIGNPFRVRDVIDVLRANGKIDKIAADAGRRFAEDFGYAHLAGVKAVDWLNSTGSAEKGSPYRVILARDRVMSAIKHLGGVGSPLAETAWHILGLGDRIKEFGEMQRLAGKPGNPHYISALVVGACVSLRVHYRL